MFFEFTTVAVGVKSFDNYITNSGEFRSYLAVVTNAGMLKRPNVRLHCCHRVINLNIFYSIKV